MQQNPYMNNPSIYNPIVQRGQLVVRNMIVQETGTFHPIVHRPMDPMLESSTIDAIANRVMESTVNGVNVTSGLLSGLVSRAFAPPAQHSGIVAIPNGWGEPRLRFLLELEFVTNTGMKGLYFIQGYSDHPGMHYTGVGQALFDEHMPWFINSYIKSTEKTAFLPNGMTQSQMAVVESAHVIDEQFQVQNHETGAVYRMRPQDIIAGMMSVDRANDSSNTLFAGGSPINDPYNPIHHSNNTIKAGPVPSARTNDVPTTYTANILNSITHGYNNMDIGQSPANALSTARSQVFERPLLENSFIRVLATTTGRPCPTWFSLQELIAIDANTANQITLVPLSKHDVLQPHNVIGSDTCPWAANSNESVMATVLASAIPSLMLQYYMTTIGFMCTNDTPDRRMQFSIISTPIFLGSLDLRHFVSVFSNRLEQEVLFDQSYGNEQTYAVSFLGDVFGETRISVSIDGSPLAQFATPSFADAKLVSVFTPNVNIYQKSVSQFGAIVEQMRPSFQNAPSPAYMTGI